MLLINGLMFHNIFIFHDAINCISIIIVANIVVIAII